MIRKLIINLKHRFLLKYEALDISYRALAFFRFFL